ncbi:hypothetical protein F2Q69_00052648 [Brassica cretica]|uniref:Uncharacterized protein n=1 Tax=Brassica cretica TaxID=69181 RepID=A0A8S9MRG0_BRACR|nr:hypothetical protein F2Q69_00052648 [Brassica cretica]
MLDSYHTSHVSREHIADFKVGWNQVKTDTGNNTSCFLVRLSTSKHSLFRWTCASYYATFRNPSFVGLVRHFKQQLKSGSIKRLSASLVSPFTPPVLPFVEFISFSPIETLRGNSCVNTKIREKHVNMFEVDQRRLFSQFEVREFCDNLVEGVVKALKDVGKIQKKSTTTRAPVANLSLFINEKLKGPIFDEEDELGPNFDEKAPSLTSINMENHLCFDPGTTPTHLTTYIQEHSQKLDLINFLSEMCVKISSQDVKRFGFDKVKEFRVSDSVFENMFNSFKVFEPDELLDQKRFQHDNGINSGFFLSFDQFLKHSKGLDHFEESLELDFCARNSFDSFVFKDNSFNLSCYRYALITGNLFASTCALDEFIVKTLLEQKSLRAKTDFCYDSVLKSDLELFSIMCPDTILVYNTYFDRLHDDLKRVLHVLGKETLVSDLNKYLSCTYDPEGENNVPLGSAPGKTDMHGMIMESSKDICSLFDPYLPNHEDSTHEITWKVFSTKLWSSSKKNQIKRSSYVTVMLFTNHVIFSSREFRPPEKLEMANLLSDEPMTNSIIKKICASYQAELDCQRSDDRESSPYGPAFA